jgi:hypothetical protein
MYEEEKHIMKTMMSRWHGVNTVKDTWNVRFVERFHSALDDHHSLPTLVRAIVQTHT